MRSSGLSSGAGIVAALLLLILAQSTTPIAQEGKKPAAASESPSLSEEVQALREELRVAKAQIRILKSTIDAVAAQSAAQTALVLAKQKEPGLAQTPAPQDRQAVQASTSPTEQVDDLGSALSASDQLMVGEVHFNPGSADLTPGGRSKTAEAVEQIKGMEGAKVRVVGYTDTTVAAGTTNISR